MLEITTKDIIIKPVNERLFDIKIPIQSILTSKEDLIHVLDVLNELYGSEELIKVLCKRFDLVTEEVYYRDRRCDSDDHINFDK